MITQPLKTDRPESDYIDREPPRHESLPTGPFGQAGAIPRCSLLIFVPRNETSALIDEMTGRYGYSHLAIDCGELDLPSGKRTMIESTVGVGVHNSFQDEYGERKFVRIPLEDVGIDIAGFCDCVRSRLGEKFDNEEALTIGLIHDPAKQICSDLATVCLPQAMRTDIARFQQAGVLRALAALHLYKNPPKTGRLFVSPNGFAHYFGAPRGKQLTGPDQVSEPVIRA